MATPTINIMDSSYMQAMKEGVILSYQALYWQLSPNGVSSSALDVTLPACAIVDTFDVTVVADRADWARVGQVGQVRIHGTDGDIATVIVDFGAPLTASAVGVDYGFSTISVTNVLTWDGSRFSRSAFALPSGDSTMFARFDTEVQTQRLQIKIKFGGSLDLDTLLAYVADHLLVQLPSMPAGLELHIDDGPAVWTYPGTVQAGKDGWEKGPDGRVSCVLSLAESFSSLTGDPTTEAPHNFRMVLSSRIPGALGLSVTNQAWRLIRATDLGPDGKQTLSFTEEGYVDIPLDMPTGAKELFSVHVKMSGTLTDPRVVPPVGPPKSDAAYFVLNPDRSACVRLTHQTGLVELNAVRLPVSPGASGAEVSMMLLENVPAEVSVPGSTIQPGQPIEGAVSETVSLVAAPGVLDGWVTFAFRRPVSLDENALPWAAVLVARGEIFWSLAACDTGNPQNALRIGPPAGPWQALPFIFSPGGALSMSGRIRMVGTATKKTPLAPIRLNICDASAPYADTGDAISMTPASKGTDGTWMPGVPRQLSGQSVVLRLTSLTPGTVTIENANVIVSKP